MTLSWSRFQFLRAGGQETAVAATVAPTAPEVDILEGGLPHQQESDEKDQPANNIDHLTSKEDWASPVSRISGREVKEPQAKSSLYSGPVANYSLLLYTGTPTHA
jgi:hypothetical protein